MTEILDFSHVGVLTVLFLFLSGVTKGAIGFGQPLVAISLLTLVHSVEVSIALISLSLVATNLKLAFNGGNAVKIIKTYKFIVLAIAIGTFFGVVALAFVNKAAVQVLLGLVVMGFVVMGFLKIHPNRIDTHSVKGATIGFVAGLIGGITSAFGPLLAVFVKSQRLDKEQFVQTLCLLILVGAATLSLSLGAFSIYSPSSFVYALLACIPTFAGLWVGEKIRDSIKTETFFKVVSVAIFVVGLNLIRAGFFGLLAP